MTSFDLTGKIAIVTGGAKGMGEAHSRLLASRGAHVIIADIDEAGDALSVDIVAGGNDASFERLDVSHEESWAALMDRLLDRFGKVDILVNNAGIAIVRKIEETSVADFEKLFNVNMKGVFLGCKWALKGMRQAGGGSIVNISSLAGLKSGVPQSSLYGATKGAIRAFTKSAAVELAPDKIRVNSVHPGLILTELSKPFLVDPAMFRTFMGGTAFDRAGEPSEVAEVVAFLASDASSYVTGAEISVDGGWAAN